MSVQTPAPDVAGYADAVRHALADLGPDQVDDLTDGLEADLAEAMADDRHAGYGRTLLEQFGPPEQYAAELRSAAGLEPSSDAARSRRPHPVRRARALLASGVAWLDGTRWWPPVAELLVSLRPAWWLLRGWVAYQVVSAVLGGDGRWLPSSLRAWAVLAVLLLVSTQWGRGRLRLPGRWNVLPLVASAAAVVVLLPTVGWVLDRSVRYVDVGSAPSVVQAGNPQLPTDGVIVGGMAVSNLFVYDAAGNPVPNAQVYDDRGRPVRTTDDEGTQQYWYFGATEPWYFAATQGTGGRVLWNVYPLQGGPVSKFAGGTTGSPKVPGTPLSTPPWPFAKAPAVETPTTGSAAGAPTAGSVTGAPTAGSATGAPTPGSATGAPTTGATPTP